MLITTIIPTYRRPQDLSRCLASLKQQTRAADEVIVVMRDTDEVTRAWIETFDPESLPLKVVTIAIPGVVAAMNEGVRAAAGEIVVFTDDDAAACADWLARIEDHFLAADDIGGVGGRDRLHVNGQLIEGKAAVVGKVQWFGRVIGNHHLGFGDAQEVEVLKGVNMSFLKQAIAPIMFDERMLGQGAQAHFECACCFQLKQAGWRLIYDPQIVVDHFQGKRFDADQREQFDPVATVNQVHNQTLCVLEYLPFERRYLYLLWGILIGTRGQRGCLQTVRFFPAEGLLAIQRLRASVQGRWRAWKTWRASFGGGKDKFSATLR